MELSRSSTTSLSASETKNERTATFLKARAALIAGCCISISICFVVLGSNWIQLLQEYHHHDDDRNGRWLFSANILHEDQDNRPSLFPVVWTDYVGFATTVLGLMLAAGGGIGGGGILVSIYILIFNFPVKHAIPLASVTVLGGAVANNVLNWHKPHPKSSSSNKRRRRQRGCIDWDLLLQLEPMTMAGALMGANLSDFLPDIVLIIMLLGLLSLTAYKTLKKAHALYQQESAQIAAAAAAASVRDSSSEQAPFQEEGLVNTAATSEDEMTPLHHHREQDEEGSLKNKPLTADSPSSYGTGTVSSSSNNSRMAVAPAPPGDKFPNREPDSHTIVRTVLFLSPGSHKNANISTATRDVVKLVGLFVVITYINLLKGGTGEGGGPMGLRDCGLVCFWASECSMFLLIVLFAIHVRHTLLLRVAAAAIYHQHEFNFSDEDIHHQSDIAWNEENTVVYSLYAVVAGLATGMFGIGGGIVKGPLMLALGVHPAVASATSACMILFTSSTATVSYIIFGLLLMDYAAACFVLGLLATLVGQTIMHMLLEQCHQRHSYIAYSIGSVVALSAVCMSIESIMAITRT